MKPPRRVENMLGVGFRHIYDALDQKINELDKKVNKKLTEIKNDIATEHLLLNEVIIQLKMELLEQFNLQNKKIDGVKTNIAMKMESMKKEVEMRHTEMSTYKR